MDFITSILLEKQIFYSNFFNWIYKKKQTPHKTKKTKQNKQKNKDNTVLQA